MRETNSQVERGSYTQISLFLLSLSHLFFSHLFYLWNDLPGIVFMTSSPFEDAEHLINEAHTA